ncbi:UDP-N-acetylglucosamine 1-carboxyvinyltransferase [Criblamydia sequanensis]|uniref:UDP-N-acetylglucosamine 1-carboxyvinyltransferase n=1 Tax=Candidatus Criblamydia sequanensis CRIB-18 TaxID=1437425 RepID=A0A090D011_9BACT|nr:UDP-N-acetylglucosamine 1-carboxyvinyltransferase [Criblamydia sequanensis]CDR34782.1 UDP-N-acetylglucosamine 1-carboxyvinyltransferase [Criblamydia sequanensis CRIB-18]
MEALKIKGGTPLQGKLKAQGAKNATNKLLVASLLSDKPCRFYNVPNIGEIEITVAMCQEIGMQVSWDREAKVMEVVTKELTTSYIPQRFSGANRIPILMIGALLGRTDQDIIVPVTGGDCIGKRPVDFHLDALRKLGANIEFREMKRLGAYFAQAHSGLKGTVITLPYPSVMATENTILASVTARGVTEIKNAAMEPEIVDLILFLQKLGAHITLDVDRTIRIQGTRRFYEVEHHIIPDRIEVASWGMAAIASKGRIFIEDAKHSDMITFLNKMREVGGGFSVHSNGIEFFYDGPLQGGLHLETDVHPGFMTDWQQPFVVLLTQAMGSSVVHETVYENRFGYTEVLKEMGADITQFRQCLGGKQCRFASQSFPHSIIVKGPTALNAKEIAVPDLRAGFAYIMAALIAEGTSTILGLPYLDRGYENLVEKLIDLGADAERVELDDRPEEIVYPQASRPIAALTVSA